MSHNTKTYLLFLLIILYASDYNSTEQQIAVCTAMCKVSVATKSGRGTPIFWLASLAISFSPPTIKNLSTPLVYRQR